MRAACSSAFVGVGSDAAREAWGPPSLRLDGGDNFLLVRVPEFIESDASLPPLP